MNGQIVSAIAGFVIVLSFCFFLLKILYGSSLFILSFKYSLFKSRWKKHIQYGGIGLLIVVFFWFIFTLVNPATAAPVEYEYIVPRESQTQLR